MCVKGETRMMYTLKENVPSRQKMDAELSGVTFKSTFQEFCQDSL